LISGYRKAEIKVKVNFKVNLFGRALMKIGELAKRSGLTASQIRFYEAQGLLNAVSRQANGYREYPAEALVVLGIITGAKQAGFSLKEIQQVLPADFSDCKHDIEAMEQQLRQSKSRLQAVIQDLRDRPDGINCSENTERLLQRYVRMPQ
jgi:DNA-binding transcriptional MerR regulator